MELRRDSANDLYLAGKLQVAIVIRHCISIMTYYNEALYRLNAGHQFCWSIVRSHRNDLKLFII